MKKNKLIIIAGLGLLGVAVFFLLGFYNIAASDKHWKITEWGLAQVRDSSITRASADIVVPDNLDDPQYFVQAAGNYNAMCSSCHLVPNSDAGEQELRIGLYPQPPDFTQALSHDSARMFWVIKHGLKMTGMPAWGASHSDEATWKLVAFIRQLPKLDNKQYTELVAKYGGSHMPGGGHKPGEGHGEGNASPHGETMQDQSHSDGHSKSSSDTPESMTLGDGGAAGHHDNKATDTPKSKSHGHSAPH